MASVSLDRINDQPLSNETKKQYREKLIHLSTSLDHPIEWIMLNPNPSLRQLKSKISDKPASLASYITPLCKMFSIHPTFKREHKEPYAIWRTYLNHYMNKRMEQYEKNELTTAQAEKMVSFDNMKKKYCDLEKDPKTSIKIKQNLQYLLLAIFLNIKPKRADLGEVYITENGTVPRSVLEKNYIVLTDKDQRLVINDYKTSKRYGTISEKLTPELVAVIKQSLALYPRKYLFISLDKRLKDLPYTKKNSYSQFVKRTFENLFEKSMGVSLWRRVYVGENVDFNNDNYEKLKENARLSGHSVETQLKIYKSTGIVQRRSDEEKSKPVVCDA